jgi:peptidoglycan/LPS O-acetylase OafA/YrhL
MSLTRHNNFDLLRLFAAYQVAFFHAWVLLKYQTDSTAFKVVKEIYSFFPGLPIFFIISGFLVSSSLERNLKNLKSYFWSRFLRIYPGLWGAFLFSLFVLGASGYWINITFLSTEFFLWIVAQLTFFQDWTPAFLKGLGTEGLNGPLWTIPVELGFYILLPILYILIIKKLASRWAQNACLIAIGFLSFWANVSYNQLVGFLDRIAPIPPKILFYTLAPHLWLFILGLLAWRNFDRIRILVERRFILWSALFIGLNYGLQYLYKMMGHTPDMLYNYIDMVYPAHWLYNATYVLVRVVLAMWVLSAAFTGPHLAEKVLRGQDISYGVYLYHVLLINLMISYNFVGSGLSLLTALAGAGILGFVSWTTVEKRFLKLKKKAISLK